MAGHALRGSFEPVDYKGGEHSKPVIRSFIASLVRLHYKGKCQSLPFFITPFVILNEVKNL